PSESEDEPQAVSVVRLQLRDLVRLHEHAACERAHERRELGRRRADVGEEAEPRAPTQWRIYGTTVREFDLDTRNRGPRSSDNDYAHRLMLRTQIGRAHV